MTKNKKIKITLIKSPIGYKEKAKKTLEALGLKRMNQSVEHSTNDSIVGMIKIVDYLVKVEEI
ncbi:MAG: 50S ribosomal protein L30 [Candidatus Marinimicrobia bacterium]|nr:50S ribosomal protein L30 [Candidatus Neomarinimicrobiota bacterium]|tara:strand:- start:3373 stop:3561 length:189 start_codon:yes stop_codon:yes gene_type:complete